MEQCGWCLKENAKARCTRCKGVYYCGSECQKKHWNLHRKQCTATKPREEEEKGNEKLTQFSQVNQIAGTLYNSHKIRTIKETVAENKLEDCLRIFLTRVEPLALYWSDFIHCAPSGVHGNGVFVGARPIPKNAPITLYPVDAIVRREQEVSLYGDDCDTPEKKWPEEKLIPLLDAYGYCLTEDTTIVGLPSKIGDNRLLGHMLNDACQKNFFSSLTVEELKDPEVFESLLISLFEMSRKFVNCAFKKDDHSLVVSVVSLRELLPGEELFVCYGLEYWFGIHYGRKPFETYKWLDENMRLIFKRNTLLASDVLALNDYITK